MKYIRALLLSLLVVIVIPSCAGGKTASSKYENSKKKDIKRKDRTYQRHGKGKRYKCRTGL